MAEPVNGGNSNPGQPPKEMSMELRLLLAFLLMGAVMFVTPYLPFFKNANPPVGGKAPDTTATAPGGQPNAATPAPEPPSEPVASAALSAEATPQQPLPNFTLQTDLYKISFSNQGGTVRSWQLTEVDAKGRLRYRGNDGKPLDLVNPAAHPPCAPPPAPPAPAPACVEFPFSLYFSGQQPASKVNWTYYDQTIDPDNLGVSYKYSDGHINVLKTFRFEKKSYLSKVSTEVTLDGKPFSHMIEWRGGFGDFTIATPADHTLYFDVTANKLQEKTAANAKAGPLPANGNYSFAGLADTYFAAVFLPEGTRPTDFVTLADNVRTPAEEKPQPFAGAAIADGDGNRFELFVGPKDVDLLKSINPKLEQVVDFGWISILAKPLFLIVNWFNDNAVHNFGWSIVAVTVAINFILFPLKFTNMKSMRKMQALKPQIDLINAKYKSIKMTDPRAAEKNQEVMDLYKKHGVNPMGGCFPMLLQLPFFFAFYRVFTVSVEMRGAPWLWVTDLSQPEDFTIAGVAIRILPIIMIATQFWMQKMTPQANTDPSQQKMMMFMPLIFGFMFYKFPSGLVLYYLTSNLVQMGQQWFFNRTEAAIEAARSVEPPKKKNGRK